MARLGNRAGRKATIVMASEEDFDPVWRMIIGAGYFVFVCCAAFGQAQPTFEVASVQPVDPGSGAPGTNVMHGGPGTADPERITFTSVTMQRLLMTAYRVGAEQISGPGWLDSARYAIVAKVPVGATRDQFQLMLQNLVSERFHLTLHHEARAFPAYELVIAKGGSKLKPSVAANLTPSPSKPGNPIGLSLDKNGFPQALPGRYATAGADNGVSRLTFNTFSISDLAGVLGMPLGTMVGKMLSAAHVVDNTGLTGKYDFTLEFAGNMGPGGAFPPPASDLRPEIAPNLLTALQTQLGLKLNDKKTSLDVLVIDHIDKVPTAN